LSIRDKLIDKINYSDFADVIDIASSLVNFLPNNILKNFCDEEGFSFEAEAEDEDEYDDDAYNQKYYEDDDEVEDEDEDY